MTARSSYGAVWRARFGPQRESCEEMLREDPFPGWERNDMPEMDSRMELTQGLRMLWAGEEEIARGFFERALAVVERTEAEKPYQEDGNLPFPRNRAAHLRTKVHAGNLMGTMTPAETRKQLSRAAADYAVWCQDYSGASGDSQAQAYALNALRLAYLAADEAVVATLLATRGAFKWHAEERAILGRVAVGDRSQELADRLLAYFDRIRDPDRSSRVFLETELVCLELVLVHELHFGGGSPLDWLAAARRVGE